MQKVKHTTTKYKNRFEVKSTGINRFKIAKALSITRQKLKELTCEYCDFS